MTGGLRKARFDAALQRLREDVRRGPYASRDVLPGERDLAETLSVSRTTVRRILAILIDEGLLSHRQGVGTFVAASRTTATPADAGPPVSAQQRTLAGFTASVRRLGHDPSSRELVRLLAPPTPRQAMLLACPPGEPVVRVDRLRSIDDEPVAVEQAALPRWALPEHVAVDVSLYVALESQGFGVVRALQRMRVAAATASDTRRLGVLAGSPIVRLDRTDYLADGRCCMYTRTVVRPDCFDLVRDLRSPDDPLGISTPD